jgi:hypothetical protein
VADRYKQAHEVSTYEVSAVVAWAMKTQELRLDPKQTLRILSDEMSAALHGDRTKDRHGRRVRRRYCLVVGKGDEQRHLWGNVEDASPGFLREALRQTAVRIRADVVALEASIEFINERFAREGVPLIQWDLPGLLNGNEPEAESA